MSPGTIAAGAAEAYRTEFDGLLQRTVGEPAFLRSIRLEAFERFTSLGFPHRKLEEWRFTDVSPIAQSAFTPAQPGRNGVKGARLADFDLPDMHRLVFVNGFLSEALSDLGELRDGVTVAGLGSLLDAMSDGDEPAGASAVEAHLARHAAFDVNPFVALNTAFASDGVVVHVPRGVRVDRPIHVLFVSTGHDQAPVAYPRALIVVDDSAEVALVESHVGPGSGAYFSCGVTEIVAGDNAVVDHYKLQKEHEDAYHLHTLMIHQGRDASTSSHSISTGGHLVRHDVRALLDGEGGHCTLNGLYMVKGTQFVDTHMFVEHAKPNCTSHELYKGILEERSKAVFNGRIFVHREAQKTDAVQSNRNLLLSREALVNSNPQLEIFADDVRCTHGSTTGHLDPEAVFYLRSRGLSEEAARSVLVYAFASDIVSRIRLAPVRQDTEEFLFTRLPLGNTVRQAV